MRFDLGPLRLDISYPLAAAMALILICDKSMSAAVCFLAVIIHESGHLLMLARFGSFPRHIKLTLFDIAIADEKKPLRSFSRELAVVLAGVAVNLLTGTVSFLAGKWLCLPMLTSFAGANFSLALFNSLPADSLDGGQALLLILCEKLPLNKAFAAADIISFIVLIPCCVLGFWLLLRSRYNYTLLVSSVYLMTLILIRKSKAFPLKSGM